jgi:hypothetical protein
MCKFSRECVYHLLLHCSFAYEMWSFVFSTSGIHWVMQEKVIDVYACW